MKSATVELRKAGESWEYQGAYSVAAYLSSQLNTPAIQDKTNRHRFTVTMPDERKERAIAVLNILGYEVNLVIPT